MRTARLHASQRRETTTEMEWDGMRREPGDATTRLPLQDRNIYSLPASHRQFGQTNRKRISPHFQHRTVAPRSSTFPAFEESLSRKLQARTWNRAPELQFFSSKCSGESPIRALVDATSKCTSWTFDRASLSPSDPLPPINLCRPLEGGSKIGEKRI